MPYQRPTLNLSLSKDEKITILREYFFYYQDVAEKDPEQLNVKIDRQVSGEILDSIGVFLVTKSKELSEKPGPFLEFLNQTSPPGKMKSLLPDEYRTFCLILNALKQWVSAEQAATDRAILGGTARQTCRSIATHCIVTGELFEPGEKGHLHHPVRDGRPPILLSEGGHAVIEKQVAIAGLDTEWGIICEQKKKGNHSWDRLRNGCKAHLGEDVKFSTKNIASTSKSFAKKVHDLTGMSYQQILDEINNRGL